MATQNGAASGSGSGQPGSLALVAIPGQSTSTGSQPIVPTNATSTPGGTMDSQDQTVFLECVYACGPARPKALMKNIGSDVYPCWSCCPCNGAKKAIEFQANKNPVMKQKLKDLKSYNPDLWHHNVRSARIKNPQDPPGCIGVLNMNERTGFINQFRIALIQSVKVRDEAKRKPMNKFQFIAWLRYKEGIRGLETIEAQDNLWNKVLASKNTAILEGSGESAVILVDKGRSIIGIRERNLMRQVSHGSNLESLKDAEDAMAQLATTNGPQGDIQPIEDSRVGTDVPALMDGQVDEEDSHPIETQDHDSQQKDKEPEEGQKKDKELE